MNRRLLLVSALAAAALPVLPHAAASAGTVGLAVLSGRPDLVSGGSALVQVTGVTSAKGVWFVAIGVDRPLRLQDQAAVVDGQVQALLHLPHGGRFVVHTPRGSASIELTDHPIGGPVFSGPQIQPWACQSGAKDAQCNAPSVTAYSYLPVGSGSLHAGAAGFGGASSFQSYDPKNPPPTAAIAVTTTDTGVTLPFIVRKEVGYLDRDQYAIAELIQPGKPWTPLAPQPQYNRKLVLMHGASCDTTYGTGSAPDVMDATVLGHGFSVASHALDNAGHNCNLATEAESLVMTKELVSKELGAIRWTIGSGCSGGSLVQQQVANAYPGVYQAITPQCSFTDAWSSSMEY
jgi:hypothetical protein